MPVLSQLNSRYSTHMGGRQKFNIAEFPSAPVLLLLGEGLLQIDLGSGRVIDDVLVQTPPINIKSDLPITNILLEFFHLIQFEDGFHVYFFNTGDERFPVLVDNKSGCNTFHNAFVVFLYAFNEIMNTGEEFFVEIAIKKFIALHLFVICDF